MAVSHRGGVQRLAPAPAAGEAGPDEQAQAHGEPRDPVPAGARASASAAMPAPVLLLSGRRRREEPPAAAGASGGLRLLVPTAAAAPTAPVGGLSALGGEREEAVAEAGRGVEDGSDRGRVPKAAGSPEIGMGASSMEDCVRCWKLKVLGHAPLCCS